MNTVIHTLRREVSPWSKAMFTGRVLFWALALLAWTTSVRAELRFQESFGYLDGPLAAVAGAPWITQGGTPFQVNVREGRVELSERESEDVAAGLAPNPVAAGDVYFSFSLEVAELPRGDGNYFIHLKDAGSSQKARVWITTNGAPAGFCRLGIANNTGTPQYLADLMGIGEQRRVIVHYRVSTPTRSELWLDPVSEDVGLRHAVAEDGNTRLTTIYGVSLRQALVSGDGMGRLWVDDLRVATTFAEALGSGPEPKLEWVREGDGLVLVWTALETFQVEMARSLAHPVWERLAGVGEVLGDQWRVKVPMGLRSAFYRLVRP